MQKNCNQPKNDGKPCNEAIHISSLISLFLPYPCVFGSDDKKDGSNLPGSLNLLQVN